MVAEFPYDFRLPSEALALVAADRQHRTAHSAGSFGERTRPIANGIVRLLKPYARCNLIKPIVDNLNQDTLNNLTGADVVLHNVIKTILEHPEVFRDEDGREGIKESLFELMIRLSEIQARVILHSCPENSDAEVLFGNLIEVFGNKFRQLNEVNLEKAVAMTGGSQSRYEYKYQKYKAKYTQHK
jgi:hypothetical protein